MFYYTYKNIQEKKCDWIGKKRKAIHSHEFFFFGRTSYTSYDFDQNMISAVNEFRPNTGFALKLS